MKQPFIYILALLSLSFCAAPDAELVSGLKAGETLHLIAFSAPWCEPCERLLPELNQEVKSKYLSSNRFRASLYIITGKKAAQPPTQAIADEYKAKLALDFETRPDFQRALYRTHYGDEQITVPALVLVTESEVKKVFTPGAFTTNEVSQWIGKILP